MKNLKYLSLLVIILFRFSLWSNEIESFMNNSDEYILENYRSINDKYVTFSYNSDVILLNEKVLSIATSKGDSLNAGRALYSLALQDFKRNKYSTSEKLFHQGISKFRYSKNNINLVISYNTLSQLYMNMGSFDSALNYILLAEKLLPEIDNDFESIRTYSNLGSVYKNKKEYPKAIKYQLIALDKSRASKKSKDIANSFLDLGNLYLDMEEYDTAWKYYQKTLVLVPEFADSMFSAYLYNNISTLFSTQKKYNLAFKYSLKSIKIKESYGRNITLAKSYQNLGALYFFAKNYELAVGEFKKGITLADSLNDPRTLSSCYLNLAVSYNRQGLHSEAIATYDTLLTICEENNFENSIFTAYSNLAVLYNATEEYEKSIEFSKKSLLKPNAKKRYKARNYTNMASSYLANKDYENAIKYATISNGLAYQIANNRYIMRACNVLSSSYAKMNQHQKAYDSLLVSSELQIKMSEEDKENSLEELRIKYDTEKKDVLISDLEMAKQLTDLQVKQLNYQRLFALILLILIVLFSLQRYLNQRKIIKIKEGLNQELEIRVDEEIKKKLEHKRAIVEQSRLVSLGELAAGIAHELNQPLQCISFALENMKLYFSKRGYSEEYFIERMGLILHDIDRMSSVVDHIRVFSRKQVQEKFLRFNLKEAIDNALSLITEQYRNHNIDIKVELPKQQYPVQGNAYQIEQVIINLLSNAKDALDEKEESSNTSFPKKINITLQADGNNFILDISNNGSEIPTDVKENIFLPFFTTKPQGKGTGLGLSIVYGIISEHNGTISLVDTKGTLFRISLPIDKEEKYEL